MPAAPALPTIAVNRPSSSWDAVQSKGKAAFEVSEYGKAERLLKEAVIEARGFGAEDLRLAKSAGLLGRLLTVRGRFAEAEGFLEEEMRVKELALPNDRGQLIPDMGSLVRFYLTCGTASKADELTEYILGFVQGKLEQAHAQAQGSLKLKKGQPLEGWAGTAAPVMRDPIIEWAITLDDIGNLYSARGNFDQAEKLFKAALDVKTTVLGKEHLSLANSYDSLGSICMSREHYEDAESYFRDSLMITEKIQPPDNPQVYGRLDKLARCLIKEGKYEEAEALYLRAQGFWKGAATKSANEARAAYALGSLYTEEKKYSLAVPVLEQALQMSEHFNGSCSVSLVPYLEKYAYALYYTGRRGEVDALKARAKNIAAVVPELAPTSKMQAGVWPESKDKSNE